MKVEVDVLGLRLELISLRFLWTLKLNTSINHSFANQPATSINHSLQPVCNFSQPFTATSLPSEKKPLESFHMPYRRLSPVSPHWTQAALLTL